MFALLLAASGCVRVYQPMSGLHRPTVVNTRAPNFQDVHLSVNCLPGDLLTRQETGALCQKVAALFENQGAIVAIADGGFDEGFEEPVDGPEAKPRTDLSLEITSRRVHKSNHGLTWAAFIVSFTLYPGVTEKTFAQDISIRDGSGFLLLTDSLEGRLITRSGAGTWLGNKIFDLGRPKEERLSGKVAEQDLSADLYLQLSQLLFNAKMHWQVMQESTAGQP